MSITPALARAVHFRFAVLRETNRTEHDSAFVANLPSEASEIREKLVALLDGKQHSYSPSPRGALLSERLGWNDPRITLGTESCAKVGSLQLNTEPCRVQIEFSVMINLFSVRALARSLW
jgi:hypothetical protein